MFRTVFCFVLTLVLTLVACSEEQAPLAETVRFGEAQVKTERQRIEDLDRAHAKTEDLREQAYWLNKTRSGLKRILHPHNWMVAETDALELLSANSDEEIAKIIQDRRKEIETLVEELQKKNWNLRDEIETLIAELKKR